MPVYRSIFVNESGTKARTCLAPIFSSTTRSWHLLLQCIKWRSKFLFHLLASLKQRIVEGLRERHDWCVRVSFVLWAMAFNRGGLFRWPPLWERSLKWHVSVNIFSDADISFSVSSPKIYNLLWTEHNSAGWVTCGEMYLPRFKSPT
jgi:hypothetical protein